MSCPAGGVRTPAAAGRRVSGVPGRVQDGGGAVRCSWTQLDLMGHDPEPASRWPGTFRGYGRHTGQNAVFTRQKIGKRQVSNAAPFQAHRGVRRFGVACGCGGGRCGRMLIGFVAVDPESSVVPMSLQVSMVAEGFHGNRGLVP